MSTVLFLRLSYCRYSSRTISHQYYPFGRSVYIIPDRNRGWAVSVGAGIEAWTGLHGAVKIDSAGHALFNADGKL